MLEVNHAPVAAGAMMRADKGAPMWQVTCECGWRTSGTQEEVVANIQEHGRTMHNRELTRDEVMAIAVPLD